MSLDLFVRIFVGVDLFLLLNPDVALFVLLLVVNVGLNLVEEFFSSGVVAGREVCGLVVVAVPVRFSTVTTIPVVLDDAPLWIFCVDVQRDADTECWSVLLFRFVEEIAFLAEENAGAPSFSGIGLLTQLLVAAFDVDVGATTSSIL